MEYMEVPRPAGDGLCSDDACPCGAIGVTIPRGEGYVYISQEVVDFRIDCPTVAMAQQKIQSMQSRLGSIIIGGSGVFAPILVCEQGAKLRNLDLEVAAADAKYWWETGHVPLRATPTAKTQSRIFQGESVQEAEEAAKAQIPEDQIVSLDVKREVKEDRAEGEGRNTSEAIEQAKAHLPSEAFDVGEAEIIREGLNGVVEVSAYSEDDARVAWKSKAPEGASLESIECSLTPKKGFLGLGKQNGTWKVNWSLPYLARVSFKTPAEVTVHFKEKKDTA